MVLDSGVGQWHIKHEFYNEMSSKSNVVNFRVHIIFIYTCVFVIINYYYTISSLICISSMMITTYYPGQVHELLVKKPDWGPL